MGVGDAHRPQLEPEVADAREQTVELRMVDDHAGKLADASALRERHAVEGAGEALAQPPAHRDPNSQGRFHLEREDRRCLRESTSSRRGFTQGDSW